MYELLHVKCKLTRNTQLAIALIEFFGEVRQELKRQGRKKLNGLEFRDHPSCAKYDNPISGPTSSTKLAWLDIFLKFDSKQSGSRNTAFFKILIKIK